MIINKNIIPLSGDASFRKFYRKKNKILVYCKKEKKTNLLNYDAINKILIKNKIKAPKLITNNYKNNFIEIEDFGDISFYNKINYKNSNKLFHYKKILITLQKLQKIKEKKIKTFLKSTYIVPKYTKKKLFDEANLFLNWYLPFVIKKNKQKKLNEELRKIITKIINNLKSNKSFFVHRDFHVSNIMFFKGQPAIIDSQDSVFGNRAYDLASLIDDVRIKTTSKEKKKIFNEYVKINRNINVYEFINDFKILSVLRNLKIIGIFTRLFVRDHKRKYLKLIPNAWKLIEYRVKDEKIFNELKNLLDKNFSKKIRSKKWK